MIKSRRLETFNNVRDMTITRDQVFAAFVVGELLTANKQLKSISFISTSRGIHLLITPRALVQDLWVMDKQSKVMLNLKNWSKRQGIDKTK